MIVFQVFSLAFVFASVPTSFKSTPSNDFGPTAVDFPFRYVCQFHKHRVCRMFVAFSNVSGLVVTSQLFSCHASYLCVSPLTVYRAPFYIIFPLPTLTPFLHRRPTGCSANPSYCADPSNCAGFRVFCSTRTSVLFISPRPPFWGQGNSFGVSRYSSS